MQANSSLPVRTFTIGFEESRYDEAAHAREVTRWLGTEHSELYALPRDALDVIPRLPSLYDEPFSDSSQILVAEMTRRYVRMALSEDGGEELFGGCHRYFRMRNILGVLSPLPPRLRQLCGRAINSLPVHWEKGVKVFDRARALAELLNFDGEEHLHHALVSRWRAPTAVVRAVLKGRTHLSDPASWPKANGLESRMMVVDTVTYLTYLPDDILVQVDRAAMGVNLGIRAPFLDHRVVEFA